MTLDAKGSTPESVGATAVLGCGKAMSHLRHDRPTELPYPKG